VVPSEAGPSLRSMTDQSTFTGRAIAWTGARLGLRAHALFVGLAQFAAYAGEVRNGCERDAATRPVRTQGELRLVAAAAA
jgi:hypothetical protein